eukprot:1424017-Rhodomonas_salina.2
MFQVKGMWRLLGLIVAMMVPYSQAGMFYFRGKESNPTCRGNDHGSVSSNPYSFWRNIQDLPSGDNDDAYQVRMCGHIPAGTRLTVSDQKKNSDACDDDTTDIMIWKTIPAGKCVCVNSLESNRQAEYFYQDFRYHTNLNGKASAFIIKQFSNAKQADFSLCHHNNNYNCPAGQGGTIPWSTYCGPCSAGTYNDGSLWGKAPCHACQGCPDTGYVRTGCG